MTQPNFHDTDYQIKLKRGTRANVDGLAASVLGVQGEPAYTTDDKNLWIHDGTIFQVVQTLNLAVMLDNEIVGLDNEIVYIV